MPRTIGKVKKPRTGPILDLKVTVDAKKIDPSRQMVGFQCTAEEYQEIVAAAEADERSVSEWIRNTLMEAARRT